MKRITGSLLLLAASAWLAPAALGQLVPIGDLPTGGNQSFARGLSPAGSRVAGQSGTGSEIRAVLFGTGGLTNLGTLGGTISLGFGVSNNGVVVGHSLLANRQARAFRWTSAGGMADLGTLAGGVQSDAQGVSADGSVVSGYSSTPAGFRAFRWTGGTGMVSLGTLGGSESLGRGISNDGGVIVGRSLNTSNVDEAFRWTSAGMVGLGDLPGGNFGSEAFNVSADGSVVVGYGTNAFNVEEAFRWENGNMIGLGDLPGGRFGSIGLDTSVDGSIVVGQGRSARGQEAFIWDAANGMRSLQDFLINEQGLDLAGFTQLFQANGISDDGRTISGWGRNANGDIEGFVVTLGQVPAPGAGLLSLIGLATIAAARRRLT